MTESDRRRLITSTPHLAPDEIVQRTFTTSFRGYSEAEVRAFLKRVSEEIVVTHEREVELLGTIDSLEEQLRSPRPLNEPEMLDALGAETTRLLRSAHEAADEIRARAEERSTQLVDDARAEAGRILSEAEDTSRTRSEEAEVRATTLVNEAEARAVEIETETGAYAEEQRRRAEHEAEELIESARTQGREMLDEAKATRERVVADLARRRSLLQAQIEALRAGRDSLLDAYRVVKRSFLEATGALSQVEARAAAERVAHENEPHEGERHNELLDSDHGLDADGIDASDITEGGGAAESTDTDATAAEISSDEIATDDAADPGLADVDSLFARIRAGQTEAPVEPAAATSTLIAAEEAAEPESPDASTDTPEAADEPAESADPAEATESEEPPAADARSEWRARRAEVLDPLLVAVSKRAKRAAQDDQNALLDAVRRHKGRPTAAQVLAPEEELLVAWSGVVREALDEAYGAGRVAVGGEAAAADDALVAESAETVVMPLRERISAAIDTGEDGDTGGLVERIGARFREWKNQSLEEGLEDVLVLAWSRGIYDASPDGGVLRWIPEVEGRCADCDDNGLEPTVKGSAFPTGQLHPPAHLGCRCFLAPSDT